MNPGIARNAQNEGHLEQKVRERIDSLSYLPTTAAVAMKFVELGKKVDADPSEYSKVISSDGSLSTKILALANSSWFGVRNRVTKVQVAVNLLGLGTVRTMAISYCLTGLHNVLRLSAEESRLFWAASLCKAVAARQLAARLDPGAGEEAFAAGLFQDFALPIMYSVARDEMSGLLHNGSLDVGARIAAERELFRLDHAELARTVALKLELPELFVDAVAFHHNSNALKQCVSSEAVCNAVMGAALFPHVLESWNPHDSQALRALLAAQQKPIELNEFLADVQKEFDQLYGYFEQGKVPETRLSDILVDASREAADSTGRLMGTVHELLQQAASAGKEVFSLMKQQDQLEQAATHDGLTGLLYREAFRTHAMTLLEKAKKYKKACALLFVDVDHFKQINDQHGHEAGDLALERLGQLLRDILRPGDLGCRFGGDEFVVLLDDYSEAQVMETVGKLRLAVSRSAKASPHDVLFTLSIGVVYIPAGAEAALEELISMADGLMYQSKRAGGNRAHASRYRPRKVA